uniref:Uncharacterized protein n=1 Tax=Fagus sylvatica TaxID=28930 RepID=A0A2N9J8N6_FAGSY
MSRFGPASPQPTGSPNRQASRSSHRKVSTGSSYRPSELTPSATLAIPPSRHTDLLIAELRREISDLRKEARGKSPTKERPRRRPGKTDRESSEKSFSTRIEVWAETPSPTEKVPSSAHPSGLVRVVKERQKRFDRRISERHDRDVLPPSVPKKKARRGEQGAVWKALDLVSSSPFSEEIEHAKLPEKFTAPRFEVYNGRTDPVAHIGHYHQRMALCHHNDPLMCRLFPSSLGEFALRWFNQIDRGTIGSWSQMAEAFVGRFITNSQRPKGMDTLMMMKLGDNESIKDYSARLALIVNKTPPYQSKKTDGLNRAVYKVRGGRRQHQCAPSFKAFQTVFKEPIYRILDKIKEESFFIWPPKLISDPTARNQKLQCFYHQDRGHLTENCHKFKTHLEQLVADGHLAEYVDSNLTEPKGHGTVANRSGTSGIALTGVIQVIHNPFCTSILPTSFRSDIQKVAHLRQSFGISDSAHLLSTFRLENLSSFTRQVISFSDDDLRDVQMPHSDPLVITLRTRNYDVKRVLINQGSFAEVMYKGLYEKLGLREADLNDFSSPVFGFSGESTTLLGKTTLPRLATQDESRPLNVAPEAKVPYQGWNYGGERPPGSSKAVCPGSCWSEGSEGHKFHQGFVTITDTRDHGRRERDGERSREAKPISQKCRKLAPEWAEIVMEDINRLLEANAIRPVQYPTWLSNTVVVRKKNRKWRVCVDFTDLNKACPKDSFPLPRIDQLEKTEFITPKGIYCYKVMLFELKNADATYQRMVTVMFGHLIGKTVEVYIDDTLIKSVGKGNHLGDLREVLGILRRDKLRLNASKCIFGVSSGKFLGHMINYKGIEANPDQILALLNLELPRDAKQKRKFLWDEDFSAAFQGIKTYLSSLPCLSIPYSGEPLFLYLAISEHAVSAVLVREMHEGQKLVFFVSKTMNERESRYLPLEKAVLALIQATKKLPHYFQASTVTVLMDLPLKVLMHSSDFSGRITKWGVHLGALGVEYKPRTSVKGQILADFVTEFQGKTGTSESANPPSPRPDVSSLEWKLFMDRASNVKGAGASAVLISPEGLILEKAMRLGFLESNNEAECEALLIGLRSAIRLGTDRLQVFCGSQLVVNHISGVSTPAENPT